MGCRIATNGCDTMIAKTTIFMFAINITTMKYTGMLTAYYCDGHSHELFYKCGDLWIRFREGII